MKKMLSKVLALTLVVALGLGLMGGAFAAEPQTGKFDLESTCFDYGQAITKVIITLDQPVGEVTAEEAAEAFAVTVLGCAYNSWGTVIDGDQPRTITGATVSEDGLTITLELDGSWGESTLGGTVMFNNNCEGYAVTLTKDLGNLTTDLALTYGTISDPAADKWAAVPADNTNGTYAYRWYDPTQDGYEKPEGGFPIIVWLHGAGEWGSDNNAQLTANRVTAWGEAETQDIFGGAYVIAPQANRANTHPEITGWNGDAVVRTIETLIATVGEKNVNRNDIVVGGCSAGGAGTWNAILAHPEYYAAAFPICQAATQTQLTEANLALLDMPIYMTHSVDDTTCPVGNSITTYNTLVGAGKTNIYMGLFEHVEGNGLPHEMALFLGHWSWMYNHNNFDGTEQFWLEEYTHSDGVTYETHSPADLGYETFKHWLAAQIAPEAGTYYTRVREVTQFGETISGITIHGLERVKATESVNDYLRKHNITITVGVEGEQVERKLLGTTLGEDRTSITFNYGIGQFIGTDNAVTASYTVTVDGAEIPYGGDDADTDDFESVTYTTPEYTWSRGGGSKTTMDARYYVVDKETYEKPEDGYALVVWLHGGGETGDDNRKPVAANDVHAWTEKPSQDLFGGAYVLAPQNHASAGLGAPAATMSVIEQFIAEMGDIDTNRIYVGGCSYGGIATWEMLRNYPYYFAAGFPICCGPTGGLTTVEANALNGTPIYMTVSTGDSSGIVSSMIEAYNALKAAGSEDVYFAMFEHSEFPGQDLFTAAVGEGVLDHWSWVYVHEDYDAAGDDYDGKNFIDTTVDGTYNDGKVTVADGVLTYTYESGTDEEGNPATASVSLNGSTSRPADAGYETFKTWMAAQVKADEYITVNKSVEAWGEIVSGITLTLETPVVDKDSITVKVDTGAEELAEPTVTDIAVSADGKTVTVTYDKGFAFDTQTTINYHGYVVTVDGREITRVQGATSDVDRFEALTFSTPTYTFRGGSLNTMEARAFTPDKETYPTPENGYPLIVWLHGGGEQGTDNRIQVAANDVPAWTEKETQDIFGGAYVLAPQNHAYADLGENAPAATMSVIQQFIAANPDIDPTRVYVGGCSYGGRGTFEMLREYPNFFAAAYPTCASIYDASTFELLSEQELDWLKDVPVYMSVSAGDQAKYVMSMITFYNKMQELGNEDVHLAIFEHSVFDGYPEHAFPIGTLDHWVWVYLHDNYDAKGDDWDGKMFIDSTVDGTYNDGKIVVENGVLTYNYTWDDEECSITLNGKTERPEDTGYATIKEWIAAQSNPTPSVFDDVTGETEGYEAITALQLAGLTNGTSATTYEPEATLTRAEFMTFLARAVEATVDNTAEPAFSDVAAGSWETGSIAWGVANELIEGYGDGTFGPEDPVTEEQVNLIIGRLVEKISGVTAADGQLIEGATDAPATRGQVASVIKAVADNYTAPSGWYW